jgi:hypothetical protein
LEVFPQVSQITFGGLPKRLSSENKIVVLRNNNGVSGFRKCEYLFILGVTEIQKLSRKTWDIESFANPDSQVPEVNVRPV